MDRLDFKIDYMTSSGNSILKGMSPIEPMLDLFVRESIQNSFDALLDHKDLKEEFNCGDFDYIKLSSKLEGISSDLMIKGKFMHLDKFISVRDYNTTGLTGPVSVHDIKDNYWGKFLNLVRNFGKSQKEAGAGGSWGYGKTTFYKMGVGIVLYYSRIKTNEEYEERLMACLVENESNKDGLLYSLQKGHNTGIAWWGKKSEDLSDVVPITDHEEIKEILSCFNLKVYENDETGTAVIIPFIDEKKLLNQTSTGSFDNHTLANWAYSIEDYLKISFQKWYPTRCDNHDSRITAIDVFINGNKLYQNKMKPLFEVIQSMYNFHSGVEVNTPYEINREMIKYKNSCAFNNSIIGFLYYSLLDEDDLKMGIGDNEPSPYSYVTNEEDKGDYKKIIFSFCRKPGMILKYDIDGDWAGSIISPNPNKYLVCLFIPNSENTTQIDDLVISIDDYLRASESAEHNNWKDITEYTSYETGKKVDCSKIKIVSFIHRRIKSIFEGLRVESSPEESSFVGSSLNKKLADLFLPSQGFGNKAKKEKFPKPPGPPGPSRKKSAKLEIGGLSIIGNNFGKNFEITYNKNVKIINLEFKISTENTDIKIEEWEDKHSIPFRINKILIEKIFTNDKQVIGVNKYIENDEITSFYSLKYMNSSKGNKFGFTIESKNDNLLSIKGKIIYEVLDPTISISINQGKGE